MNFKYVTSQNRHKTAGVVILIDVLHSVQG